MIWGNPEFEKPPHVETTFGENVWNNHFQSQIRLTMHQQYYVFWEPMLKLVQQTFAPHFLYDLISPELLLVIINQYLYHYNYS